MKPDDADPEMLVTTRALQLRYGAVDVLRDVDLEVRPGDHIALTGRSGSGKTTLLLVLAGLVAPSAGQVSWPDLVDPPGGPRGQIGMVFQAPSLMPELNALENVLLPLRLRGSALDDARTAAMEALAAVDGGDLAQALPYQLSGGQQQRVAIARALAGGDRLVLADEPTGALDRAHALGVMTALLDAVGRTGGALVVATHDPQLADLLEHHVDILDGRLRVPGWAR